MNNYDDYNSKYQMDDHPIPKPVRNPYKICFILNLISLLLASIPSIFGVLYVLFWLILGIFTFFWVWVELDFDFFGTVAKFSFLIIPFCITSLILNIISFKLSKSSSKNVLMFVTSLIILFFDIILMIGLIFLREQICYKYGNGIMIVFVILQIAGIICAITSIILFHLIKKQNRFI